MKFLVNFTVPGIKAIVPCHFEIFIGNMLNKQLNKLNSGKGFSNERIIFMLVVMKSDVIPIIRINSGKGDDWPSKVAADILDNRVRVAEIWLCVNIKAIFVFLVYFRFCFFKRRANAYFQFI